MTGGDADAALPRVCVLLATHNGLPWLPAQLDSILGQQGVQVEVLASDDASSDGTRDWLRERAAADPRLTLLADPQRRFGRAATNFYHLLEHADLRRHALFAFADQDDIWDADKLLRHVELLERRRVEAVSSDVTAFWPSGRRRVLKKSFPQRRWDHLLEPPGPGCSFLMRRSVVQAIVEVLADLRRRGIEPLPFHDWMAYLVARSRGLPWWIDDRPSLLYRQHARNEVGANVGARAAASRLRLLWHGHYRALVRQAMRIAAVAAAAAPRSGRDAPPPRLSGAQILLQGRRRRRDALIAALFLAGGVAASNERAATDEHADD